MGRKKQKIGGIGKVMNGGEEKTGENKYRKKRREERIKIGRGEEKIGDNKDRKKIGEEGIKVGRREGRRE